MFEQCSKKLQNKFGGMKIPPYLCPMKKPKFYQAVLVEVKGNVLDHVYPHLKGSNQLTMTERMGSEEAKCPDCGGNTWMLLAKESTAVSQGGKPYCECLGCGLTTHL